jgi:sugar-specific transcriptional regulator TrmB
LVVTVVRATYKNELPVYYKEQTVLVEEEAVKRLQSFGLMECEAEMYLFLARVGSCPVGVIARRLGTNRMSVYRTLKVLEERGLVESTVERPSRFVALPVINFLSRCIDESKTKTTSLEKSKEGIVDYFEHLKNEPLTEEPKFRIVQGRKHIFDQVLKMLETAKKETCIIQTRNGLYRYIYAGIDDKLKELHDKGVDVMVLTQVDETGVEAVRNYLGFADVRHASFQSTMRMVIVDEIEALTTFARDDSMSLTTEKDLAMWVRAPDYAQSMKMFFETAWKDGVLARHRLAEIEAQQALRESLEWARGTLDADGWTTMMPGKLTGESGVEHSFELTAKYPDERNSCIVVDSFAQHGSPQILAFSLKALDVGATVQLLVTSLPPNEEECELARQRGIKLISAGKSQQLAAKIASETNKIIKTSTRADAKPKLRQT